MSIRAIEWALSAQVGHPQAKIVLICLANNADDEVFECWPSADYIAQRVELSRASVYRAIHFLIEHGFIRAEKRKWPNAVRRTPKYTLLGVVSIRDNVVSELGDKVVSLRRQDEPSIEPSQRTEPLIFVEYGTDAWKAWARHYQAKKINSLGRPPITYVNGVGGWYFPTEFPQ